MPTNGDNLEAVNAAERFTPGVSKSVCHFFKVRVCFEHMSSASKKERFKLRRDANGFPRKASGNAYAGSRRLSTREERTQEGSHRTLSARLHHHVV